MPTANWPLQSFSYFYLVLVLLPVNIVNLVHMCLRTNKTGGRQFNMFMSENICTMVDLFDKAVVGGGGGGGARQSLWKGSQKVTTRHRNIDR